MACCSTHEDVTRTRCRSVSGTKDQSTESTSEEDRRQKGRAKDQGRAQDQIRPQEQDTGRQDGRCREGRPEDISEEGRCSAAGGGKIQADTLQADARQGGTSRRDRARAGDPGGTPVARA